MLQFHWYLRVGSDPCHFANFANDVSQNVPRTTKTELDAGFHSTRSRERKRAQISSQNASKIVPESSKIIPQSSQRSPEELQSATNEFQRASQESPDLPTELLKLPRAVQGASKGSPRDPLGGILGRFGPPNRSLGADVDSLSELSSSSCKPGCYFRNCLRLLPFSLHSSHSSHCINPLRRFAQSPEISGGSTRGLLRSERGRASSGGERDRERERERN